MSYQVLARKWRPKNFQQMVGQSHVLQALVNALEQKRLHHAYLFTGTRGVGKTSVARIVAKCLNCDQGISAAPCGVCDICQQIDAGNCLDLLEVDAASRTKVEDTRELLDNVQYAPAQGRFKIYLIDEVHMLSMHSFNALLKTLEEPPEHVKFLLATTDPQKLPVTVLSRCLQFHLLNITPEHIALYLAKTLEQESIAFEPPALQEIARVAQGSMRDALTLADQAIAHSGGTLTRESVIQMLGGVDRHQIYHLVQALLSTQTKEVMHQIALLARQSTNFEAILAELLTILHRMALALALPDALDNSHDEKERILPLAAQTTPEDVQLYYQIGVLGQRDMPYAPDPRSGFEMTLLRMLTFQPDVSSTPKPTAPKGAPQTTLGIDSAQHALHSAPAKTQKTPNSTTPEESIPADQNSLARKESTPQQKKKHNKQANDTTQCSLVAKKNCQSTVPDSHHTQVLELTPETWSQTVVQLNLSGVAANIVNHSQLVCSTETKLTLMMDERYKSLYDPRHGARINKALCTFLKRPIALEINFGHAQKTPAIERSKKDHLLQKEAWDSIANDTNIKILQNNFGARILENTLVTHTE